MMKKLRWLILSSLMVFALVACPTAPDTTPPTISITTPSDNSSVTTTSVTVTGTASDDVAISSLEYTLNGGVAQPIALASPFTVTVSNLVLGKNVVVITAKDGAGNLQNATFKTQRTFGDTPTVSGKIVNWNTASVSTGKIRFEIQQSGPPAIFGNGNIDTQGNFSVVLSVPPSSTLMTNSGGACGIGNAFKYVSAKSLVYNQSSRNIGSAVFSNSADGIGTSSNLPVGTKIATLFYVDTSVTGIGTCGSENYNLNLFPGWNFLTSTQTTSNTHTFTSETPTDFQWYYVPSFEPLGVSKAGTGAGTISSSPSGIDCGTNCTAFYKIGTAVTLTATPAPGSSFVGWSEACTGTTACTVILDGSKFITYVTATFALNPI